MASPHIFGDRNHCWNHSPLSRVAQLSSTESENYWRGTECKLFLSPVSHCDFNDPTLDNWLQFEKLGKLSLFCLQDISEINFVVKQF